MHYETGYDDDDRDAPLPQDVIDDEEEATVTCPHCGRQAHEDAPRCPYCGFWIVDGATTGGLGGWSWTVALVLAMLLVFVWTIL